MEKKVKDSPLMRELMEDPFVRMLMPYLDTVIVLEDKSSEERPISLQKNPQSP
jgi:hypothetical protein